MTTLLVLGRARWARGSAEPLEKIARARRALNFRAISREVLYHVVFSRRLFVQTLGPLYTLVIQIVLNA